LHRRGTTTTPVGDKNGCAEAQASRACATTPPRAAASPQKGQLATPRASVGHPHSAASCVGRGRRGPVSALTPRGGGSLLCQQPCARLRCVVQHHLAAAAACRAASSARAARLRRRRCELSVRLARLI
jgi:hypothetical protein